MWKLAIGLLLPVLASAEVRRVCVQDRAGLNEFTRKAFEGELRKLIPNEITAEPCAVGDVVVVVSAHPPARYGGALGLAYHNGDRVFPELRIFTRPVLRLVGERASAAQLGRALARVAAHEMGHYSLQQLHHEHEGLMRAGFAPSYLAAEGSTR